MIQRTYRTLDPWQAAWLHLLGIELLTVRTLPDGRAQWEFSNDNDTAWQAGMDFRTKGSAVAPLLEYREAYRYIQFHARQAREETASHDHDRQE